MNDGIEPMKSNHVSFTSYIVRLYRFQKNKPQRLMGIVEEVGTMKKSAFANYDELWTILNAAKGIRTQKRKGDKRNKTILRRKEREKI